MASFIRPNRTEVSRTFPWLGFTIRAASAPAWFEVAIATDPSLFDADAKSRRTSDTFYSTRAAGPIPAPSGEAVWIVPPAVLARFVEKPKLFYALATFSSADRQSPEIVRVPAAAAPSVALSRSFTGVTRRLAGVGGRTGDASPDYGSSTNGSGSLEWAGDTALTVAPAHSEPAQPVAPPQSAPEQPAGAAAHASALDFTYSDGLGALPEPHPVHALGDAIDIYWGDVEAIGQPTNVSCWAAAAAMVVGWRDLISINPDEFARLGGRWSAYNQNGLSTNDNAAFAQAWRLTAEPPADPSVDGFARMLQNYGPLWIGRHPMGNQPGMGHAVAVIGLHGDGTPDGTFVHWNDPWPPGQGTPNRTETYTTFLQEFDDFITSDQQGHVNSQILHADGTGGRTAGHVPAASGQSLGAAADIAVDAAGEAVKQIAGFYVERLLSDSDNIQTSLDQWPRNNDRAGAPKKYPWDDNTRGGTGATQHKTFTLGGPETDLHWIDDVFCELQFNWDYNGNWLTNVSVEKGRRNGPGISGGTLHVTAHLDDVPGAFAHMGSTDAFGALRYNVSWEYHRTFSADIVVHATVMLYGDGSWKVTYDVLQGNVDVIRQNPMDLVGGIDIVSLPQPTTQSLGAGFAGAEFASGPPASSVTHNSETRGSVHFELDQYTGMKEPPGVAPAGTPTQTATVRVGGPHASMSTGGDESFGDCEISYEYDGRGLGNVQVRPTATGGTAPLVVAESITDDTQAYAMPGSTDPLAALKLSFEYRFDSTRPLKTDVTLYGNGRQDIHYDWSQV